MIMSVDIVKFESRVILFRLRLMHISIIKQIKANTRFYSKKTDGVALYFLIIFAFSTDIFINNSHLAFAEPKTVKVEHKIKGSSKDEHNLALNAVPMIGITDMIILDPDTGVALYGFDPVAYFIDGEAKLGSQKFVTQSGGVIWQFKNEGNRTAFIASPESYIPVFGGHDAIALQKEQFVAGDPKIYQVLNSNLYLFRNIQNRQNFMDNEDLRINATQKWVELKSKLVKPH